MADELRRLRQIHGSSNHNETIPVPEVQLSPPSDAGHHSPNPASTLATSAHTSPEPSVTTYSIGSQRFEAADMFQRLTAFLAMSRFLVLGCENECPQLDLYHQSPVLFWTMISVACRLEPFPAHVQQLLYRDLLDLVHSAILFVPMSLNTVRALIILSLWPLPTSKWANNSPYLYCNLAVTGARSLGINQVSPDDLPSEDPAEVEISTGSSRTWLTVFSVSAAFSIWHSDAPCIKDCKDLADIEIHIRKLPSDRRTLVTASLFNIAAKYFNIIDDDMDFVAHERVLSMSCSELDSAACSISGDLPNRRRLVTLQATKMALTARYLEVLYRIRSNNATVMAGVESRWSHYLIVGIRSAVEVVDSFDLLKATITAELPACSLPIVFSHLLSFAVSFLDRWTCCLDTNCGADRSASEESIERGRDMLRVCFGCFNDSQDGVKSATLHQGLDQFLESSAAIAPLSYVLDEFGCVVWSNLEGPQGTLGSDTGRQHFQEVRDPWVYDWNVQTQLHHMEVLPAYGI